MKFIYVERSEVKEAGLTLNYKLYIHYRLLSTNFPKNTSATSIPKIYKNRKQHCGLQKTYSIGESDLNIFQI